MRISLLITIFLAAVWGGGSLWAKPALVVRDYPLQAQPVQVRLMTWRGAPALSVMTEVPRKGKPPRGVLYVLSVVQGEWKRMGRWELPDNTRYMEPLRFSGGRSGWLAMVRQQWRIAVPQRGGLQWTPVCACPTIYAKNSAPHRTFHKLVFDLTGDGRDEVVLPYPAYLEVYRTTEEPYALEPMWRLYWDTNRRALTRRKKKPRVYHMPDFAFPDIQNDGRPEMMIERGSHLSLTPLPPPRAPGEEPFTLTRAGMEEIAAKASPPIPAALIAAVESFYGRTFPTAGAFLAALYKSSEPETTSGWAPHLVSLLRAGRRLLTERTPYRAKFPGLGAFNPKKDKYLLLAKEDMNGDGILDVLHVKVLNHDSKRSRQNILRWYRGGMSGGRLRFEAARFSKTSDVGSFATVIHSSTNGKPPHELLVASTNVSFYSVMRAIATGRGTLAISIFPWKAAGPAAGPRTGSKFVFESLKQKGRRVMFLAADLDGDGQRDYLLNRQSTVLSALLSAGSRPRLTGKPLQGKNIALPSRQNRVLVTDLDRDGREEVIAWYRVKYHGKLGRSIRMIRLAGK
ncbi:MAG: VCBS repeat-containing protein [bacterium]